MSAQRRWSKSRKPAAIEFSYDHRGELLSGTSKLPSGGKFDIAALTLDAAYRLPAQFGARVRVPIYWKTFSETDMPDRALNGLGDIELSGTFDFVRAPRWVGVVGLGIALPTGDTSAQPIAGSAVPTPLQLGTGTFDPLFFAFAAYRPVRGLDVHVAADGRAVLYANSFHYQAASVYSATLGSEFRALGDRLAPALDLELGHTTHTSVQEADIPNTGRDVVYVAPRLRVRLVGSVHIEVLLRLPVFQSVNETQFGETVEASFRVSYTSLSLVGNAPRVR